MSFGYSVGDVILLLQLARRTYSQCKEAGGEYLEIAREVKSLYSVLRTVRDEAQKPDNVSFQSNSRAVVELVSLTDGCKGVLNDISLLLAKYKGLAPGDGDIGAGKKLWHRLKFGNEIEGLGKVRQKIITYTSTIAVLLDTIHLKATGRVENKVEAGFAEMLDRFQDIRRTILYMATKARIAQRSGSVTSIHSVLSLTTYAEDDKEVWRRFRAELIAVGFRSEALDRHMEVLKAYMMRLDQSGILDEAAVAETSSDHNSPWWSKSSFVVTATSLPRPIDDVRDSTTSDSSKINSTNQEVVLPFAGKGKEKLNPTLTATSGTNSETPVSASPPVLNEESRLPVKVQKANRNSIGAASIEQYMRDQMVENQPPELTSKAAMGRTGEQFTSTAKYQNVSDQVVSIPQSPQMPIYQRPTPNRAHTLSFPVSDTAVVGSSASSRPVSRLTQSANPSALPTQTLINSSNLDLIPNYIGTHKRNAAEEEDAAINKSLTLKLASKAEEGDKLNYQVDSDLFLSYRDAESWYMSHGGVLKPQPNLRSLGDDDQDQDPKAQRPVPPHPTAESYYSDIESTSSHSTLLRSIDDTNKDAKLFTTPLNPYAESYHTDDTISNPSHYSRRPFTDRKDDADLRPNSLRHEAENLGQPYKHAIPGGTDLSDRIRMERTQEWAAGLKMEDPSSTDANRTRSPRPRSQETRSNADNQDALSVSHKSVTSSKSSNLQSKLQKATKAALLAGATQAFRAAGEPGSWDKEKGKGVIAAALDAGGIKDEAVRNVVQEFIGSLTGLGAKEDFEQDDETLHHSDTPSRRSDSPPRRTSIYSETRQSRSRRRMPERRRTVDWTESPDRHARRINDYSHIEDSSDEERKAKLSSGKKLLSTGLAVVSTIHAANNIYGAMAKREARRRAVESGMMSVEEMKKLKAKAALQDIASTGIAALSVKGALSDWKEAAGG